MTPFPTHPTFLFKDIVDKEQIGAILDAHTDDDGYEEYPVDHATLYSACPAKVLTTVATNKAIAAALEAVGGLATELEEMLNQYDNEMGGPSVHLGGWRKRLHEGGRVALARYRALTDALETPTPAP